ncbi:GerMN domain-containing protein [Paenibacillus sp.]|uniref:GerMN domain-containing protein n=1 Tax=Paenibacillus sp. TaxID=58172 RepID=UPI00281E6AF1|nr:GerMN domain-containing protein [Paenibacillus sp.]MDR0270676.1 GerMN domain-containing protein [Paenibacillus sp.]
MNRKILSAALLAFFVVAGVGCGQKPAAAPVPQETAQDQNNPSDVNAAPEPENTDSSDVAQEENSPNGDATEPKQTEKPEQKPDQKQDNANRKQTIEVFYTDPQEMELKKSDKEIRFDKEEEKYKEAFKALQESGNSELIPLWGKIELKSLEFKDGAMTLNIHMPDEARLGAGGEQFALDALSKTMFQFKEVQTIELLVDGEQVESLMGHVDLDHPMKRN